MALGDDTSIFSSGILADFKAATGKVYDPTSGLSPYVPSSALLQQYLTSYGKAYDPTEALQPGDTAGRTISLYAYQTGNQAAVQAADKYQNEHRASAVSKALRYTGAGLTAPFVSASASRKIFGLNASESKNIEIEAKVGRGLVAATAVVLTGGAALGFGPLAGGGTVAAGAAAGSAGLATGGVPAGASLFAASSATLAIPTSLGASAALASTIPAAAIGTGVLGSLAAGAGKLFSAAPAFLGGLLTTGAKAGGTLIGDVASGAGQGLATALPSLLKNLGGAGEAVGNALGNAGTGFGKALGGLAAGKFSLPTPGQSFAAGENLPSTIASLFGGAHLPKLSLPATPTAVTTPSPRTPSAVTSPTLAGFSPWMMFAIGGAALGLLFLAKKK